MNPKGQWLLHQGIAMCTLSLAALPLQGCAVIDAGGGENCYARGYAIGRGETSVVCTPSSVIYKINPGDEFPEGLELQHTPETIRDFAIKAQRSGDVGAMKRALELLPESETELRKTLTAGIESAETNGADKNTPPVDELATIKAACEQYGCTIMQVSDTHIQIKGGPPDQNVVTGAFDMLWKVGVWLGTHYFGGGMF